jgi:hypothetical protein
VAATDDDQAQQALVVAPRDLRLRPARSVAEAAAGEVIFFNRRAEVMGPRRVLAIKVATWSLLGGTVLATGILYGAWFSPLVGALASGAVGTFTWFRLRNWPKLRAALALAATSRWEEAHAALLALEGKSLPRGSDRAQQVMLGTLDVLLGRPEAALARLDRILAKLRGRPGSYAALARWRAASVRAGALARLGRLDEARRQRDELVADLADWERRHRRPRGEFFDILVQSVELAIAFEADAPDQLPDNETLYKWARAALARTRFGELLVSLAWAFHRRGDQDMARHLLAESGSRIERSSLPVTAPRLHAWAEQQRRISGP